MYTIPGLCKALVPHITLPTIVASELTGVYIDSRQVKPGGLFVALTGDQTDGHLYLAAAFEAGAAAALVHECDARWPCIDTITSEVGTLSSGPVQIRVEDTLGALQKIAHAQRIARPDLRVIGVTGSVGKTTAKEAIAIVLAQMHNTLYSQGNYNNEIGLPLTLMQLVNQSHAVLEMGMYDLGEIRHLCDIAQPQMGVVTNVGPTHLERLGTIDRIAQAKAELVQSLPQKGTAFLNGDDERVRAMESKTEAKVITFGLGAENDLIAEDIVDLGVQGVRFKASIHSDALRPLDDTSSCEVQVGMVGQHSVMPALAATAVGLHEGLTWAQVAGGLRQVGYGLRMVPKRGIHKTTIIDDTYNSSPTSALAALDVLGNLSGKHIAILGDMLELGSYEQEGHAAVGRRCAHGIDLLITLGKRAQWIAQAAIEAGLDAALVQSVQTTGVASALVRERLRGGEAILIKGSRGMAMETIVQSLEEPDADD